MIDTNRYPLLMLDKMAHLFPIFNKQEHSRFSNVFSMPLATSSKSPATETHALTEIEKQLHLYKAIAENAHSIISAKDISGHYLYVNDEYCRLFHKQKSDFIGKCDLDIFPAEIAKTFRETDLLAQQSRDGITVESKVPVDGNIREFITSKFPIRNEYDQLYATGLVATEISDLKLLQTQLRHFAEIDSLTGSYNRRKLFELAEEELDSARRYSYPFSVLMCDLDHFKLINDTYGHAVGDIVIRRFAEICQRVLRKQDVFGRIGGEEFAILLPHTDAVEAEQTAARIQYELLITQNASADATQVAVTVSIGISGLTPATRNFEQILHQADNAMYQAKQEGRNCIRQFSKNKPQA